MCVCELDGKTELYELDERVSFCGGDGVMWEGGDFDFETFETRERESEL